MANTAVSTIRTRVLYDLAQDSDDTDRDNELISYINEFNQVILLPLFMEHNSNFGWTEWNTTETVANVSKITCPSSTEAIESLYLIETEDSGTADAGAAAGTSVTLDSDTASSSDDAYNSYYLRTTGGTGDGQQFVITDYDGDTYVATVDTAISTGFSTDTTYVVFKPPAEENKLEQKRLDQVLEMHTATGIPDCFAFTAPSTSTSYITLGKIPADIYVLQGWYYARPTTLTATTDYLPYQATFDHLMRQWVSFRAMNRDEYNTQVEMQMIEMFKDKALDIIHGQLDTEISSVPLAGVND